MIEYDNAVNAIKDLEQKMVEAKNLVDSFGDVSIDIAEREEIKGYINELTPKEDVNEQIVENVESFENNEEVQPLEDISTPIVEQPIL